MLIPIQLNAKQFYRKVEMIFQDVNTFGNQELFARTVISRFHQHLGSALGIHAVHLYEPAGLLCDWGEFVPDLSEEIDALVIEDAEFPWIGTLHGRLAAILPATDDGSLIGVFLMEFISERDDPSRIQEITTAFAALHYAVFQNLRRLELQDTLEQARLIQMSLLPASPPSFASFDIAALTVPALAVGGDIYDFHTLRPDCLGLALGDASGHGFPAALQARDVITGLRMGWDPEMDLVRTIEKLNGVIHRSGLGSRFVSLVAGTLNSRGLFQYVNAGHPPPLVLDHDGFRELSPGGMILGPFPWTHYKLEETALSPGSLLLLYSDGVTELCESDCDFGKARLKNWMDEWKHGPAGAALADLFRRLSDFAGGRPFQDDATAMLIHRRSV